MVVPVGLGLLPGVEAVPGHAQRAAQPQDAAEDGVGDAAQVVARMPHVDVAHPDPGVHHPGLQRPDEVLEVTLVAGAEDHR